MIELHNWLSRNERRFFWWRMLSVGSPMGDLPCRSKLYILRSLLKVIDVKNQLYVSDIQNKTFFFSFFFSFHKLVKKLSRCCNMRLQKARKYMDHKQALWMIHFFYFGASYKWANPEDFLCQESVCKMDKRKSLSSAWAVYHVPI